MKKIAQMAMLDTHDAERLKGDIESLIEIANTLTDIKCEKDVPCNVGQLREDMAKESCENLSGRYILVPKVVGE